MEGAPRGAPLAPATLVPAAFASAITLSWPSYPDLAGVALTTASVSFPVAFAAQISLTPDWVLARLTRAQASPPPDTVADCALALLGPSKATMASTSSPDDVVVRAGAVSVPLALTTTCLSMPITAGGGAELSTVTVTGADVVAFPAASRATARIVWLPALTVRESQLVMNGGAVSGVPTVDPSTENVTSVTPTLSAAV